MEEKASKRPFSEVELSPEKQVGEMDMGAMRALLCEFGLNTIKQELKEEIQGFKNSVEDAKKTGKEAKTLAEGNKAELELVKVELEHVKRQLQAEHDYRLKNESQSRRSNLRFYGISEAEGENDGKCEDIIIDIVQQKLEIDISHSSIERCHRLGPKRPHTTRPIIVKFTLFKDKDKIWRNKKKLQGTQIFLKEDFPPEIEQRRSRLMPVYLAALRDRHYGKVSLVVDKLFINGNMYTVNNLHQLPPPLRLENIATKSNDDAVWFWRRESPFSNHHACNFMEKGIAYNCTEQYLMYAKAKQFGDDSAADKIMKSNNPVVQKQTKVANFHADLWKQTAPEVMKQALLLKFNQNPDLKKDLLATGEKMIAEASPHDEFWGCGFGMNHPDVGDPKKWTGTNMLGKCLMDVRREIK